MSIVKDPVVGLIRRDAGGQDDPVLEALRRGEDIADRRANLLRLAMGSDDALRGGGTSLAR